MAVSTRKRSREPEDAPGPSKRRSTAPLRSSPLKNSVSRIQVGLPSQTGESEDKDDEEGQTVVNGEQITTGDRTRKGKASRMVEDEELDGSDEDDGIDGEAEGQSGDEDDEDDRLGMEEDVFGSDRPTTSSDAYFLGVARASKTSDNRLSSTIHEPFTKESFLEALNSYRCRLPKRQKSSLQKLGRRYDEFFRQWYFELSEGFNILCYGTGSKRGVLNRFGEYCSGRGDLVIVNAFIPSLGIGDILDAVEERVLGGGEGGEGTGGAEGERAKINASSVEARAQRICRMLEERSRGTGADMKEKEKANGTSHKFAYPIYLIIHNIESPSLRARRTQTVLALLASQPEIHLIASVDHVRSMLMFTTEMITSRPRKISTSAPAIPSDPDQAVEEEAFESGSSSDAASFNLSFNFLYHEVTTFAPYSHETTSDGTISRLFPPSIYPPLSTSLSSSDPNAFVKGALRARAALSVLSALTDRARGLFKMLASKQIEALNELELDADSEKEIFDNPSFALRNNEQTYETPPIAIQKSTLEESSKDSFLIIVSSHFDAHLAEFRDHRVVLSSFKPPEGVSGVGGGGERAERDEWLWIPMGREDLEGVLGQLEGLA